MRARMNQFTGRAVITVGLPSQGSARGHDFEKTYVNRSRGIIIS